MAVKRTVYYRTIDIVNKYGCTREDVRQAIVCGLLKAHKRSNRWYILMDQPEAFDEFEKKITRPTIACSPDKSMTQPTPSPKESMESPIGFRYMADKDISETLLPQIENARRSIKIATSNFKNLHIKGESIFSIFERKVNQGVKIQVLCMSINETAAKELDTHVTLKNSKSFKIKVCPRNHMKMFSFDWNIVYVGSANLTNAAMGSRTKTHMNFENGIITDDRKIVAEVIGHFDRVWIASACDGCKSKICAKNQ